MVFLLLCLLTLGSGKERCFYTPFKNKWKSRVFFLGPSKHLPLSREVRHPIGCQGKSPTPSATTDAAVHGPHLSAAAHSLPSTPPTLLHLRAAPTLHSDTDSAPPDSQSQLLLPVSGQCPSARWESAPNPGCPGCSASTSSGS